LSQNSYGPTFFKTRVFGKETIAHDIAPRKKTARSQLMSTIAPEKRRCHNLAPQTLYQTRHHGQARVVDLPSLQLTPTSQPPIPSTPSPPQHFTPAPNTHPFALPPHQRSTSKEKTTGERYGGGGTYAEREATAHDGEPRHITNTSEHDLSRINILQIKRSTTHYRIGTTKIATTPCLNEKQ